MWPWEHLAVGYLLYSGGRRLATGEPPGDRDTLVLALGTQFPDLVDKPLAWTFDVLPSGLSLAHSLLFAVPVCVGVLLVAYFLDETALGTAFAVGYLSHPFTDVLYGLLAGGELAYGFLFWPLVSQTLQPESSFLATVAALVANFQEFLATPRGRLYLLFDAGLLFGVFVLWLRDGHPGTRLLGWRPTRGTEQVRDRP